MVRGFELKDGSRIAIIGGGPAGSFFAHFIQKYAHEKGLSLSITIFDGKDFLLKGPKGCNLCAGILSDSLHQKLIEEGIFLPERRIINRLEGYYLHVDNEHLLLSCEEDKMNKIATVFRGNGPRYSTFPAIVSFDDFLLSLTQDKGAKVISQPVWDIKFPKYNNELLSLFFGKRNSLQKFDADLVVGAFGVNSFLTKKMQDLGFGYKPPSTLITYQAELKLGKEKVFKEFGNIIHVYMPRSNNIRYATVIPKGDYISVTLIGKKNATKDIFSGFIKLKEIRNKIPHSSPQCFCYPKIAISPSKNPFTDRLVIIGDASFSRHYKNGIESAFITAKLAAETAYHIGIDASSFSSYFYKKAKMLIIRDNYYGRFLFLINDIISSIPLLTESHLSLTRERRKEGSSKKNKMHPLEHVYWQHPLHGNIQNFSGY
jgi:flavin-dependent dehydrogenase